MYGMINKAVEGLVRQRFGDETWERIAVEAGVEDALFLSNESYPDEVTYRLVKAASEVLGLPAEQVLQVFGEHWVLNIARVEYGPMMTSTGKSLPEFLQNLDHLHSRIGLIYPRLIPPSFRVTDLGPASLRLHYHSTRDGLAPFVVGLLGGLATLFHTRVVVEQVASKALGADHDEFLLRFPAA